MRIDLHAHTTASDGTDAPAELVAAAARAGLDVLAVTDHDTVGGWSAALEARKDEAIAIQSQEVYDRYMRYLTGCADLFRQGYTDVCQFSLVK